MSEYGKKHICVQCGCKFYDLNKEKVVCPKCRTDQKELSNKTGSTKGKLLTDVIGKKKSSSNDSAVKPDNELPDKVSDLPAEEENVLHGNVAESVN